MKNSSFACSARTFVIFGHFADEPVLSRREMTCFAVMWTRLREHVKFCILPRLKRWFELNSSIVGTHFASIMTLNN